MPGRPGWFLVIMGLLRLQIWHYKVNLRGTMDHGPIGSKWMFSFVILKLSLMPMVHGHVRFVPVLVMAKARVLLKKASRAAAWAPSVSRSRKAVMATERMPSSRRFRKGAMENGRVPSKKASKASARDPSVRRSRKPVMVKKRVASKKVPRAAATTP